VCCWNRAEICNRGLGQQGRTASSTIRMSRMHIVVPVEPDQMTTLVEHDRAPFVGITARIPVPAQERLAVDLAPEQEALIVRPTRSPAIAMERQVKEKLDQSCSIRERPLSQGAWTHSQVTQHPPNRSQNSS